MGKGQRSIQVLFFPLPALPDSATCCHRASKRGLLIGQSVARSFLRRTNQQLFAANTTGTTPSRSPVLSTRRSGAVSLDAGRLAGRAAGRVAPGRPAISGEMRPFVSRSQLPSIACRAVPICLVLRA